MFGGLIAAAFGSHQTVFLIVGALSGVAALLVWFGAVEDRSTRRAPSEDGQGGGVLASTLDDLRQVFQNPALRSAAALVFALQFSLGAINPLLDLYVRDLMAGVDPDHSWLASLAEWGVSSGHGMDARERLQTFATSLLFGTMAVANLASLSAWGMYGDRLGHRRALVHCAVLCILALTLQAAAALYLVLLVGRMVMGVGMAGTGPLAFGLAAGEASADRRGGAFGVVFSARTLAVAIGGSVGGLLYPWLGARGVLVGSNVLLVVALWAFLHQGGAKPEWAAGDAAA